MDRQYNYDIVLNKIFKGDYLIYNLGHELKNFIKDDNDQRYVYINSLGEKDANKKVKYCFHFIESPKGKSDERTRYELVAISEIDIEKDSKESIYEKQAKKEYISLNIPKYNGFSFYEIFKYKSKKKFPHIYTYIASNLFVPNDDKKIYFRFKCKKSNFLEDNNNIYIDLMCNPLYNHCYASENNESSDIKELNKLLCKEYDKFIYIKESDENIDLNSYSDEQCFMVINDRTNLEDSMSNQIAYFLSRDRNLTYKFLHDFLNIGTIEINEVFEITREEKHIDLLFKSKNHVIVIENKIDSGLHDAQLNDYYTYVEKEYKDIKNKLYFILKPEYNSISEKLIKEYENGDKYIKNGPPKTYKQLFEVIKNEEYAPTTSVVSEHSKFMFDEFKKSIEYLTWSKAQQLERTSYIRLKQRIEELTASKNHKIINTSESILEKHLEAFKELAKWLK